MDYLDRKNKAEDMISKGSGDDANLGARTVAVAVLALCELLEPVVDQITNPLTVVGGEFCGDHDRCDHE